MKSGCPADFFGCEVIQFVSRDTRYEVYPLYRNNPNNWMELNREEGYNNDYDMNLLAQLSSGSIQDGKLTLSTRQAISLNRTLQDMGFTTTWA